MKRTQMGRGLVVYERDREDLEREAAVALARKQAAALPDAEAARVGALFPQWEAGRAYQAGERVSDGGGRLFRVVQGHTSQADWPVDGTPALYEEIGQV